MTQPMNNREFIIELAQRTGYKAAATQKMASTLIDALGDAFQEGASVDIDGFGTFEVKKKVERIMVNPSTQQRILVPPKLVLGFRPDAEWRDEIRKKE